MDSILDDIKRVLGIDANYTPFDVDIIMHINAAFSTLNQLGVGPEDGFFIVDNTADWSDIGLPGVQLHMVKTWMYLKVRSLFDPPATSYLIEAQRQQLAEFEWRLNVFREDALVGAEFDEGTILDGGGP